LVNATLVLNFPKKPSKIVVMVFIKLYLFPIIGISAMKEFLFNFFCNQENKMSNMRRINIMFCLILSLTACAVQSPQLPTESQKNNGILATENSSAVTHKEALSNSPVPSDPSLYLLPNQNIQVGQIGALLDSVNGDDNIILYVHGRAGGKKPEPGKSLKHVLPSLAEDYKAKAIMFYWPGADDGGATGFPDNRAQQAAPALAQTLKALQQYKQANAARLQNVKFTLLLHSLGNIVFEQFMNSYPASSLNRNLFDTVILNSSASAAKGHDVWLRKVDFTPNLYVTVNDDDSVLRLAGFFRGVRLGKSLKRYNLAPNAIYVNFTNTGVNHRYFLPSGQEDNSYISQFYETVMDGKKFNFEGFEGIKSVKHQSGATIYQFKDY
jgi:hypothetical protein